MRRFAIFAAVLLVLLPGKPAESQVTVTVTGGKNYSSLTGRHVDHTVRPWDFGEPWTWHGEAVGIAFGFPVSDNWGIQVGGALSEKGYWEEYDRDGCPPPSSRYRCPSSGGINLSFHELTVLSDRRIELGDRVLLHLLAGPFLGYMDGRSDDPRVQPFDFGVAGEVQLEVGLHGNVGIVVSALHTHGLVNTYTGHQTRTLTLRGGLSYSIR